MSYIIYDDDNHSEQDTTGHLYVVNDINEAKTWNKVVKANNVCKEVKRSLKGYNFKVRSFIGKGEGSNNSVQPASLVFDVLEMVDGFCSVVEQMDERKPYIKSRIHELELEMADIEHAAEFYNLNAAQGYKLYKMLHDALINGTPFKFENQTENVAMIINVIETVHAQNPMPVKFQ